VIVAVLLSLVCAAGCTRVRTIPEPDAVVNAYVAALEKGDTEAIYGLMSEESRRAISKEELAKVVKDQRAELAEHAKALASEQRSIDAEAEIRFADGEIVGLDLEEGGFRVTAADGLPAAAKTPEQALSQLRKVLARRSYAGLLRVLSPRTRAAMENDLRTLVEGLNEPGSLRIEVVGDAATVTVPGGHQVKLRREDGIWHVDDFN
jgi:hypothetical protein